MSRIVFSALLLASLAACEVPPQSGNVVSGFPAYDSRTRTLWVNGREDFYLPPSVGAARLANADRINVTWEQQGDRRVVRNYTVESTRDRD